MTLEELVVKISSDTSELESGFSKIGAGAGKVAGAIGKTVAAATVAGAAAVGALAKSAIESYAEYEQLIGGVETLFKDSAGVVEEYANNAYKTAGMSANQYMETVTSFSASLLQSLDGDTAAAAKAADMAITDMADNANKMGSSIESIQNAYQGFAKQNYTMLDNLKLGYGGTKAEMERLLADATLLSGIEYNIDNLNDVYDAIHVVQTELGITGTTAQEASSTISGSLSSMKAAWANMLTGIADENADFDTLIGNLVDSVGTFAENIIPRIETAFNGISTLITKLAPIIAAELPKLIEAVLPGLIEAIVGLVDAVVGMIPTLLPVLIDAVLDVGFKVLEALIDIFPELITAIIDSLLLIVDAISENLPTITVALVEGLITIVMAIVDNLPMFLDAFLTLILSLVDAIVQALPVIIAALPQIIQGILDYYISAIPMIIQAGIDLLISLVEALPEIIQTIVAVLPQIIESIIGAILEAIPLLIQAGIDLLVALVGALPEIIIAIVEAIPQIIGGIIDAVMNNIPLLIEAGVKLLVALVTALPRIIIEVVKAIPQIIIAIVKAIIECVPQIAEAGLNLVKGLFNGISNAVTWLYEKIRGWVSGVLSFIKGLFGIKSPSRVFAEYGKFLDEGLAKGLEDNVGVVTDAMEDTAAAMEDAFNPDLGIPEVAAVDMAQLDSITAKATVTPVLSSSGLELEQESKLQTILTNSNSDVISTMVQLVHQLIKAIEDVDTTVIIGDDEIAESAARGNSNYKKRTGQPLLA